METGSVCHVKQEFFDKVEDSSLLWNKGDNYRPHFVAIQDERISDIYWLVPISSKFDKYSKLAKIEFEKYGVNLRYHFGKVAGRKAVFLIQNAFPILPKYISHEHTLNGVTIKVFHKDEKVIKGLLKRSIEMHRKSKFSIFYPNVDKIYNVLLEEI